MLGPRYRVSKGRSCTSQNLFGFRVAIVGRRGLEQDTRTVEFRSPHPCRALQPCPQITLRTVAVSALPWCKEERVVHCGNSSCIVDPWRAGFNGRQCLKDQPMNPLTSKSRFPWSGKRAKIILQKVPRTDHETNALKNGVVR